MGLGGYSPAPDFVGREARGAGRIEPGTYRVISYDKSITHNDFATLDEARKHADDVASEADYDDVPPAAYIVDSGFECVDMGIHYGIRQDGMTAWESYLQYKSPSPVKPPDAGTAQRVIRVLRRLVGR